MNLISIIYPYWFYVGPISQNIDHGSHWVAPEISANLKATMLVYVLKLTGGRYYVGKTAKLKFTLSDHTASGWTKKYAPLGVEEIVKNCQSSDEDKCTLRYMNTYGAHNVRGGSYSQMNLSHDALKQIASKLHTMNNICYRCSQKGHFARDCPNICDRCGRRGHSDSTCNATSHVQGRSMKHCMRCRKYGHTSWSCYETVDRRGNTLPDNSGYCTVM